jgi:hypothetical protein
MLDDRGIRVLSSAGERVYYPVRRVRSGPGAPTVSYAVGIRKEELPPEVELRLISYLSGAEPFLRSCQSLRLLKNLPTFHKTRRFIIVYTRARHWSLSWAKSVQSIPPHLISLRSILMLFTHLRLGLPSGQISGTYKTAGKIIVLYILIFTFLGSRREDKRFWTEW